MKGILNILAITLLTLPTLVFGQTECHLFFSVLTKDSSRVSELIVEGRRSSLFKNRRLNTKYHEYDVSFIADTSIRLKNNNVPKYLQNDNSYVNLNHIGERFFDIIIGIGRATIDSSFTIEVYHQEDTMSLEFLNPGLVCDMQLDSIFFKPGYYVYDLEKILVQRYGGEIKKSERHVYFAPDKEPAYYDITPFEWTLKREED